MGVKKAKVLNRRQGRKEGRRRASRFFFLLLDEEAQQSSSREVGPRTHFDDRTDRCAELNSQVVRTANLVRLADEHLFWFGFSRNLVVLAFVFSFVFLFVFWERLSRSPDLLSVFLPLKLKIALDLAD